MLGIWNSKTIWQSRFCAAAVNVAIMASLSLNSNSALIAKSCFAQSPQNDSSDRPAEADPEPDLPSLFVVGKCMGPIRYQATVVDPPDSMTEETLQRDVQTVLDRINERMSTYIDDSDISRFNASTSTDFIDCDAATANVVKRAIEISEMTDGAFDITVGPAVELWGFGRNKNQPGDDVKLPATESIQKTLNQIGYKKLTVRDSPPAIKKSNARIQIDLSAIAKGYAVDQVAEKLSSLGCKNFLVEVGGEVRARGHRVNRAAWRVGVKRPDARLAAPEAVIAISNGGMATSGDYANFVRIGKKRFSHTIDPVTARPVNHGLASACILAGDCMTADALATAAMVMGLERSKKLLAKRGSEFHLIQRAGDFSSQYECHASESFPFVDESDRNQLASSKSTNASGNGQMAETETRSIWPVFLAAVCVFGLMIVAMAVGAIFNNKPVRGSCGGLANVTNEDGETSCGVCSKPVTDCVERENDGSTPSEPAAT
jgi:thiamine biosynthesis lipoprotein